jgi:acyl-homoserine lactone acylase PvdQ
MPFRARRVVAVVAATALAAGVASAVDAQGAPAAAPVPAAAPSHAYRAHDYADGRAMSILPPGENGLVNAADAAQFLSTGQRPFASDDQLGKYANLLYGYHDLTDANLGDYYNDESFGVRPADVTRTETPGTGVTIYRDTHDVPHIYGDTNESLAFGAGYAQAEDRLFLMDVLRHYGEGTLASFLGGSCEFEQMDHDQLLLSPYTRAEAVAQVDALPTEYGAQGETARSMIYHYVDGVNAYVRRALTNPLLLPADYAAAVPEVLPGKWSVADVVAIAGLIGGIFGRGGGAEIENAHLLQYLQHTLGTADGDQAFQDFRTTNDPLAPTTVVDKSFPYEIPGQIDPSTTALPDYNAAVTGGPVNTASDCSLSAPNPTALAIVKGLNAMPKHMSNALVVNASHSADGHPVAVFGPQVSYYAPQILSELDMHSPTYDAEGASFPGTGIVELGRGRDYAWSATSAGSDLIDVRLEKICNPDGGTPDPEGTYYLFRGECLPMTTDHFKETVLPKPGGVGGPAVLDHVIHRTQHGIVQGWTTSSGAPVAIVLQRSTYRHDVDSVIGFLQWGQPAQTHNVQSWMNGASKILYTFNWFYVDTKDTGYYVSGLDPIRPSNVDPNLPTWGTGRSEWHGYLAASKHVQEVNPAQGYFVSWNNKPAPGFAAADDQYGYGQVFRSIMLTRQLDNQLAAHAGKLTRSDVVIAMETAASQDLDGITVLATLLDYLDQHPVTSPALNRMLDLVRDWIADGSHRLKADPADTEYAHAAAVAIADELMPNLIRALYDPILRQGGISGVGSTGGATTAGYKVLPMQFVNTPNSGGAHLGSAYDGGYESYLVATLQQLLGQNPVDGFGPEITSRECGGGPATCDAAIETALRRTRNALITANGSTDPSTWTQSSESKDAGQTMPVFDAIQFRALGIVGQPAIDWQNRPTFQQVIEFPRGRGAS